ncbi:MAG: ribose 5-phosphate isomerase B [Fusobacteriaceae bacterium]
MKRIALGADHGGFELKNIIKNYLSKKGYEVIDFGTNSMESVDYPNFAKVVGESVTSKETDFGILVCGTGVGISIAANKVHGIRCALCTNTTMARLTREHNDANVLALGGRIVGDVLALEMVETFLTTEFEGGRHSTRVGLISCMEE